MYKPKMILFDYGHTLVYEPDWNYIQGEKAVFEHIISNPNNVTLEQINHFSIDLFNKYEQFRKQGCEPSALQTLKYKYGYFNLEFDVSYEEIQQILWDNTSWCYPMPYIERLLKYLNDSNIRTGVISNIGWTGNALKNRLDKVLPNHNFEFVIASSDYAFRKPYKMLFDLALNKAELNPVEVWYCGDSIKYDIMGAHNAGIFPVLYENKEVSPSPYTEIQDTSIINFDYLHINCWNEFIDYLLECD
ncbi:MAG: HAD family hydrolase [Eubacterium sp.]|nr:HAD family hydrolase [Eubacterium sp.]